MANNYKKSRPEQYNELTYYTLSHKDPYFIHQNVIDAYAAQRADEHTKPMTISFALIGLYLYIEKNYTGKQVQQAHMQLAEKKRPWPTFDLPKHRGEMTVSDVMGALPGPERDKMIRRWCVSIWDAYRESHKKVADLVQAELWPEKK
jgi:hypothetical protein